MDDLGVPELAQEIKGAMLLDYSIALCNPVWR